MVAWAMADFQLAGVNYSIIKVFANARQALKVRPLLGPDFRIKVTQNQE
jgi:hypothetical protein